MKTEPTHIPGLLLIEPDFFVDERGSFWESYRQERYVEAGIISDFIQDNHSHSRSGVLRGLHYTIVAPQAQLVYVSSGEIFDVAVDLRSNSNTFGHWYGTYLDGDRPRQIFIPAGFAHGFCVTGTHADVHYKTTHVYNPDDEGGIRWCDPDINIKWPIDKPLVGDRDAGFPALRELPANRLPNIKLQSQPADG